MLCSLPSPPSTAHQDCCHLGCCESGQGPSEQGLPGIPDQVREMHTQHTAPSRLPVSDKHTRASLTSQWAKQLYERHYHRPTSLAHRVRQVEIIAHKS